MIQANELRIGNLVRAKSPEKTEYEEPVVVTIVYLQMFCDKKCDFEPIPLTEEWLLKFGGYNDSVLWKIMFPNSKYECLQFIFENDGVVFRMPGRTIGKIKYAHQLQNLYFSLTNQELEIKDI